MAERGATLARTARTRPATCSADARSPAQQPVLCLHTDDLQEEDCIGILPSSDKISQLKPLGDRVLIKCAKAASSSAGGVLLANESADKPTFGEVRALAMAHLVRLNGAAFLPGNVCVHPGCRCTWA